jgi:hypothetical protein
MPIHLNTKIAEMLNSIKNMLGQNTQPDGGAYYDQNGQQFLQDQQDEYFKKIEEFEPVKMEERARDPDMPAGLKNIGNSK